MFKVFKELEAVKQDGIALRLIAKEFRTEELKLEAVKQNGFALGLIEEEDRTEELKLEAVKQNGKALMHIEEEDRTEKIRLEAIKQNGFALNYIAAEFITEEMMLEAHTRQYDITFLGNNIKVGCEVKTKEEWLNTTFDEIKKEHGIRSANFLKTVKDIIRND